MPAAQREVINREIRFTLRFRRTITIAARSVSSSFAAGQAATRRDGFQQMDLASRYCFDHPGGHGSSRIPNSRAMTRLEQQAEAK
jgi:hypothetical protein